MLIAGLAGKREAFEEMFRGKIIQDSSVFSHLNFGVYKVMYKVLG